MRHGFRWWEKYFSWLKNQKVQYPIPIRAWLIEKKKEFELTHDSEGNPKGD